MNGDANKPKESNRPSHEAAKVVIPFDIDMSEIESKISDLERRLTGITSQKQPQQAQQSQQSQSEAYEEPSQSRQQQPQQQEVMPDWRNQPMSYTPSSRGDAANSGEDEKDKAVLLASIVRMTDLLRQINDTVLLMYSQMMSGRNNA